MVKEVEQLTKKVEEYEKKDKEFRICINSLVLEAKLQFRKETQMSEKRLKDLDNQLRVDSVRTKGALRGVESKIDEQYTFLKNVASMQHLRQQDAAN